MALSLFAETEPDVTLAQLFQENWLVLAPVVLGFLAIYLLLPKARRLTPIWGGMVAGFALLAGAVILVRSEASTVEAFLFYAFAGLAIGAGVMMITQSNPVHRS